MSIARRKGPSPGIFPPLSLSQARLLYNPCHEETSEKTFAGSHQERDRRAGGQPAGTNLRPASQEAATESESWFYSEAGKKARLDCVKASHSSIAPHNNR